MKLWISQNRRVILKPAQAGLKLQIRAHLRGFENVFVFFVFFVFFLLLATVCAGCMNLGVRSEIICPVGGNAHQHSVA